MIISKSLKLERCNHFRVLPIVMLLAIAFSGCARIQRADIANKAQTELVGMSKKDLFLCAGVPVRQERIDELEFLTYAGGGDGTGVAVGTAQSGLGVGVISTKRRYCEVTFILSNGIVKKINYQGRTGGWASKGEQCAFVVENCLQR